MVVLLVLNDSSLLIHYDNTHKHTHARAHKHTRTKASTVNTPLSISWLEQVTKICVILRRSFFRRTATTTADTVKHRRISDRFHGTLQPAGPDRPNGTHKSRGANVNAIGTKEAVVAACGRSPHQNYTRSQPPGGGGDAAGILRRIASVDGRGVDGPIRRRQLILQTTADSGGFTVNSSAP